MHWTVVVKVEGQSVPPKQYINGQNLVEFQLDTQDAERRISHGRGRDTSWGLLDRLMIPNTPDAATDLLRFAVAVYAADCKLPRKVARDAWSRSIDLHIPVVVLDKWRAAKPDVDALLRFLTGDVWRTHFHEGGRPRPPYNDRLRNTNTLIDGTAICLLSGGLDSLIGAADALARGERLYLVSHNQGKYTADPQAEVVAALKHRFGDQNIRHFQTGVHPPSKTDFRSSGASVGSELTMRSRSLLFFAYGCLIAASLDGVPPLLVPENGFITINPPLMPSRVGSHSTRTTHPNTIRLFERILRHLGLPVELRLDYRFKTKGEMLAEAKDSAWVRENTYRTVSCSKPNWTAIEAGKRGLGPVNHCGSCLPCIIRRAALNATKITGERYLDQQLNMKPSKDSRAFAIALERLAAEPNRLLAQVLGTGPINPNEVELYLDVVRRGFAEVRKVM